MQKLWKFKFENQNSLNTPVFAVLEAVTLLLCLVNELVNSFCVIVDRLKAIPKCL